MRDIARLVMQIGVIIAAARPVGDLFRKIGQPQVMGEMVAGILLGPSLLKWAAPKVSSALFPPSNLSALNASSIGGMPLRDAGSRYLDEYPWLNETRHLEHRTRHGVISPALFSMAIFMALITTLMTAPLLEFLYPARHF